MVCRDGAQQKVVTAVKIVRAAKAKSTYKVKFVNNEDIIKTQIKVARNRVPQ